MAHLCHVNPNDIYGWEYARWLRFKAFVDDWRKQQQKGGR